MLVRVVSQILAVPLRTFTAELRNFDDRVKCRCVQIHGRHGPHLFIGLQGRTEIFGFRNPFLQILFEGVFLFRWQSTVSIAAAKFDQIKCSQSPLHPLAFFELQQEVERFIHDVAAEPIFQPLTQILQPGNRRRHVLRPWTV